MVYGFLKLGKKSVLLWKGREKERERERERENTGRLGDRSVHLMSNVGPSE